MQILSLLQKYTNCSDLKLFSSTSAISFHGFPFPKSCLEKSQHFQHSKVKLCPQKRHCFFFSLLKKSKYLREWVSLKDLSKSRRGMKFLCFSSIFFEKEISCFQVHYFTLIETQPTFKTAELLRTNLDWIRLPRDIVKEIMKGYKLEETIWKERKKEKDWGKK